MASTKRPPRRHLRLLLDQGFPKPPGFRPEAVDQSLEVVHLSDFDRALSERRTPDWVLYCVAKEAGFDALVSRDFSQADQAAEMFALSRLTDFDVVTWRKRMDDPISEWGQLLAYLPLIRKHVASGPSRVVFLPEPSLSKRSFRSPKDVLGVIATQQRVSNAQVRAEARREIADWQAMEEMPGRFDRLLGMEPR